MIAAKTMTGEGVYPFTSPYTVWAGGCADAKPTANGQSSDVTTLIPAGSPATQVDIWEPSIKVDLTGMGSGATYRVVATPTVAGCAPTTPMPATGTLAGTTSGTGTVNVDLPYGDYAICAQRTRSGSTVRKYASPNPIANDVRLGRTVAISFTSGTSSGSC